tara:strand:+ start:114 stop:788 length:675 start_codon:yes stop_codon:yes gene_type:complete
MQRFFDISISGLAILFLLPLFIIVIFLLRFTGEGEVFFRGERIGKNREKFQILKFVTMVKDSPNIGTGTLTVGDDPRILPLGKYLRNWKINELPQLLNIFSGQMSIVGPRPQSVRNFNAFLNHVQDSISKERPGLTGIGSLFFRNEEVMLAASKDPDQLYDSIIMPYKGELELWYANNKSIFLYFKLIWLTAYLVVFSKNLDLFLSIPNLPKPKSELLDLLDNL